MNFSGLLRWVKNNLEWTFLIALVLILAVGGGGYYYYLLDQHEQQALELYRQAEQQYMQFQHNPEADVEQARERFRRIADEYSGTRLADNSLFFLARSYYLEDNCEQALPVFDRLTGEHPNSSFVPPAFLHMGECQELLDQPEQAILSYQSVADGPDDHPLWAEAMLRAAQLETNRGNHNEARQLVDQVLDRRDRVASSWVQQAEALAREISAESG